MTPDLYWLTLTALISALVWLPYILDRIARRGLLPAMGYASPDDRPQAAWAERLMAAHRNATENLAPFAALVLTAHVTQTANETTAMAAMIFFLSRLVYTVICAFGVPVVRTLVFAVSWLAMIVIALAILGLA